jgi:hypothetical protein
LLFVTYYLVRILINPSRCSPFPGLLPLQSKCFVGLCCHQRDSSFVALYRLQQPHQRTKTFKSKYSKKTSD